MSIFYLKNNNLNNFNNKCSSPWNNQHQHMTELDHLMDDHKIDILRSTDKKSKSTKSFLQMAKHTTRA